MPVESSTRSSPETPSSASSAPPAPPSSWQPERGQIQVQVEPTTEGPRALTEGPDSTRASQHWAPPTDSYNSSTALGTGAPPTATDVVTVTATAPSDDYDVRDFNPNQVWAEPGRGDTVPPLLLPPLPTTRSQPGPLDISHGGEEGGATNEGGGASASGDWSSSSGDSSGGAEAVTVATRPSGSEGAELQPAVVFKEDVTATPHPDQSLTAAVDGEASKPPFHLIIVNVHDKNQSGESWSS